MSLNNLLAQEPGQVPVSLVNKPSFLVYDFGAILSWLIRTVFVFAGLFVFYHLVMGALKWISSGGEKEKVEKARNEITTAIIGLIILFVVVAVIALIEQVFGFGLGFMAPLSIFKFGAFEAGNPAGQ